MPDELKYTAIEKEVFPEKHDIVKTELNGLVGIKTRYNEDTFLGGHTSAWGSTFDRATKRWGFKCCLCYDRDVTRCLGEVGKMKVIKAREEAEQKAQAEKEAEERKEQQESD